MNSTIYHRTMTSNQEVIKSEEPVEKILDDLEQKGLITLQELLKKNKETIISETQTVDPEAKVLPDIQADLMSIITNGAKEVKEKTGRPMSYAEMRYAYG